MGGALGSVFSNVGQGGTFNNATGQYGPSALQSLTQGAAKGAGQGMGRSMQRQSPSGVGGGGGLSVPGAMPVDPAYFAPSATPSPGTPQPMMPNSQAFYGQ